MRLHLAFSILLLASLLPALPAAAAAPPGPAPSDECAYAASTEVCVYEHWSTGDTCVAVHRGEWVHVTRCAPLRMPTPRAAPAPADAAGRICTYHLVESVAVCAGTDGCVTIYLGPSARTVCAGELIADPYVCTTHLIESVSVCENADGCLALYLGPREYPLCVVTAASASGAAGAADAADACTSVRPFSVCMTSEGSGNCVAVYVNRFEIARECWMAADATAASSAPALDACVPDGIEAVDVCLEGLCPVVWLGPGAVRPCHAIEVNQCVFDDGRSRVCWENGADGLCVYGNVAHPSFRECVGRATTASTPASVGVGACAEPTPNLKVCRYTNAQGDSCVRVEVSYSSWEECLSPAIDVTRCVEPTPNLKVCRWTSASGASCVGVYVSYSSYERCLSPRAEDAAAPRGPGKACAPGEIVCAWTSNGEVCTSRRTGDLEDPRVWCQRVLA